MLPSMERLTDFWLGILAKLREWVRSSSPLKNHVKEPHFGLARKVRGTEISPPEVQVRFNRQLNFHIHLVGE